MAELRCENNTFNREIYISKKNFLICANKNICVVTSSGIYGNKEPIWSNTPSDIRQNKVLAWSTATQI